MCCFHTTNGAIKTDAKVLKFSSPGESFHTTNGAIKTEYYITVIDWYKATVSIPQMVRLRQDIKISFIIYLKAKKVNIFLSIYGRAKK